MCLGNLKTWLGAAAVLVLLTHLAAAAPFYFVFISDQRVITVEPISQNELILNAINLGDDVWVIHPYDVLLQSGLRTGIGQVFRKEQKGDSGLFYATHLIQPHEFVGVTVVGELFKDPDRAIFRSSSHFFFLQKMEKRDFDVLERQITEIDLKRENSETALKETGITRPFGNLVSYPDGETEALNALFPETGRPIPPRVIVRNDPKLVPGIPPGSEVEVQGLVSKKGEFLDAKVRRGISPEADRRALAVVQNSWKFLPALQDGEVVEATVTLKVKFVE